VPELVGWQGAKALLNEVLFISLLAAYFQHNFLNKTKLTKSWVRTNSGPGYAYLKLKRKRQCGAKKTHLTN
jgi:hypothetical protein